MNTYQYTREYRFKDFLPRRRYIKRFCSTNCTMDSYNRKKKSVTPLPNQDLPVEKEKEQKGITFTGLLKQELASWQPIA